MTGSEDFPWEEKYILGYGSKKEHDKLRKTRVSYLDNFELLELNDYVNPFDGLTVKVKRLEDQKEFNLSLSYLKATDKNSKNYQLLEDHSFWQVNWC